MYHVRTRWKNSSVPSHQRRKSTVERSMRIERTPSEHTKITDRIASSQLMTPEQCAAFLQIKINSLYVMVSQKRIPYRKVGNRLRFDLDEIVEWTKRKCR